MNLQFSDTFKLVLGIAISIISLLGFFGINTFTDFFGNKQEKEAALLEKYFHETHWKGTWTGPDDSMGTIYLAEMNLSVDNKGKIDGIIKWKLSESNEATLNEKLGEVTFETITGDFNFLTSKLSLVGSASKYNLKLSENKKLMIGQDINEAAKTVFEKTEVFAE